MIRRAYEGLFKEHKVNMEAMNFILLSGLVSTGYYFTSCFVFWSYYLSLKLLNRIEDSTRQNLGAVFEKQPRSAWIVRNGTEIEVPFDSLQAGDIAAVKAGEIIPADGFITEGIASVDQHILTGESCPLEKGPGDPVFASTLLLTGSIRIRIEKSGKDTVVAKIGEILKRTVDFKTTVQSKGEKIADQSVVPTLAAGIVALPLTGPVGALAVLNSYIGSDVRILVPLSTLNFLKIASRDGILIKDGRVLELLVKTDTVVFDKTGTLTLEQPHVREIHVCDGYSDAEVLRYAATAENRQSHPIARAILEKASAYEIHPENIADAKYEIGYGIRVRISDALIRVGSARFMESEGIEIPGAIKDLMHCCHENGHSLVMVAREEHLAGAIELEAAVRPEVREIIRQLKNRGKSLYILTGDSEKPARILADDLGIENCFAEVFPEQKAEIIEQLQKEGRSVCFVGDGINDSVAMKKAHVSVSLRGASAVATDTASIILMDGTLNQLDRLFGLAQNFNSNVNTSLLMTIVPGLINVGSVFILHTGIYFSVFLLYLLALPAGMANSFLPLIKNSKQISGDDK
jgi:Cu2+-exporting ATPase